MKALLICKGEYRYSFPAIARTLRSRYDCEVVAMAFTTPATRMLEQSGAFTEVHNLAAFLKQRAEVCDPEESIAALRATEFARLMNTMVYADRILLQYPFERVIGFMAAIVRFWEDLFREIRPDIVVGEVACATEWVAWCIARSLEIEYLIPYPTPLSKRVIFVRSPQGGWDEAEDYYQRLKQRDLTPQENETASRFLEEFRAEKVKPPFLKPALRSPFYVDWRLLAKRLKRIPFRLRTWLEDGQFEVGSYHGTPPWQPIWTDGTRGLRHLAAEALHFAHAIPPGRKLYFPLHFQPEYTTDVRAPFCTNQIALIENIAKAAPPGYRVVVKEHPGMKGSRALNYYRPLRRLYNAALLSPSVDGHDLITSSDVVLTITGTTAWEAILYEKPVIAFGPLCYGYFDLIYHCRNIEDLPDLLAEALTTFRPNRTLLLKFIWSILATAHTFEWGDGIRKPAILEPDNLDRIAAAIMGKGATLPIASESVGAS